MTSSAFFLNPPGLPGTVANREGSAGMGVLQDDGKRFVYPPHLLAASAAALRQARWRVAGLDAVALDLDTSATLARLPKTDLLVIPASYATLPADRAFLNALRDARPLLPVIAIGPALNYPQVRHGLNDLVDVLLAGEPELAMAATARRLLAGDLAPGQLVNPYALAHADYLASGVLADLDALPVPAWEIFLDHGHGYPFLSVLSSRGCPAGCGFCPYVAAQGNVFRAQSPQRTADELTYVAGRFHPAHVVFRDPVFAHDRSRVLALCSELRHRNLKLSWECESRPEHFDGRLLRAMQAAGCTTVKVGLESADPELLVAIGRTRDEHEAAAYVQHVATLVDESKRLGVTCRVFVMAGLPGQTMDSARQTAGFLRRVQPSRLHVKAFHWYPGIALPHATAPDVDAQVALLASTASAEPRGWRRLVRSISRLGA